MPIPRHPAPKRTPRRCIGQALTDKDPRLPVSRQKPRRGSRRPALTTHPRIEDIPGSTRADPSTGTARSFSVAYMPHSGPDAPMEGPGRFADANNTQATPNGVRIPPHFALSRVPFVLHYVYKNDKLPGVPRKKCDSYHENLAAGFESLLFISTCVAFLNACCKLRAMSVVMANVAPHRN